MFSFFSASHLIGMFLPSGVLLRAVQPPHMGQSCGLTLWLEISATAKNVRSWGGSPAGTVAAVAVAAATAGATFSGGAAVPDWAQPDEIAEQTRAAPTS